MNLYEKYRQFKDNVAIPYLEILRYLWVPAFTALLSLIVFTGTLDQTLEIYRVFALNVLELWIEIGTSFLFIFLLSLSIWYSSQRLLKKNPDSNLKTYDSSPDIFLPVFLGFLPLLALGIGLFRALNIESESGEFKFVLALGFLPVALSMIIYLFIVFREIRNDKSTNIVQASRPGTENLLHKAKNVVKDTLLFRINFLVITSFGSILVFSVFSFPLITTDEHWVKITVAFLISVSWYVFITYILPGFTDERNDKRNDERNDEQNDKRNDDKITRPIAGGLLFLILLLVAFRFPPLAAQIGSISIIALFLIVFVFFSSSIYHFGSSKKIPFIALLLILAIGWSFFDWNDNHQLREFTSSTPSGENSFQDLKTSFNEWIEYRKKEIETKPKYPIYIVSAQGGGIYAAYHAALTLSRLQDSFPDFANHVFAISGVSGGSLGATVFSSLVKEKDSPVKIEDKARQSLENKTKKGMENNAKMEDKARKTLDHDFLAPLLAAGVFPDLVQRFLPLPFNFVDRARGLEYAFEHAWTKVENLPNPLQESFYKHWNPEGTAPALILNTTVVETGERLVLSPFKLNLPALKDIRTVASNKNLDFSLSTAAVLSARFPFVTPAAWFMRSVNGKEQKARLVDGGIFENSGVSTAYDIGQRLEEILKNDNEISQKVQVIYLAIADKDTKGIPKAEGLNELMSPINSQKNAQSARGFDTIAQLEYSLDDSKINPSSPKSLFQKRYALHRFRQFYLHDQKLSSGDNASTEPVEKSFPLPLGWFLSKSSQDFIQRQIDVDKDKPCPDDLKDTTHNTCVFRTISEELKT